MVSRGDWGPGDDNRMLRALWTGGASEEWDVQWGGLVEGRTEAQARRRWSLMIKRVPNARNMGFSERLEFLVDHFMPSLKEENEAEEEEG